MPYCRSVRQKSGPNLRASYRNSDERHFPHAGLAPPGAFRAHFLTRVSTSLQCAWRAPQKSTDNLRASALHFPRVVSGNATDARSVTCWLPGSHLQRALMALGDAKEATQLAKPQVGAAKKAVAWVLTSVT